MPTYDSLGQVTGGTKYFADGSLVPGQQFGYQFDDIGNRKQTTAGGDNSGSSASLRLANYSANNLNQITQRDYPGTNDVLGVALATNAVTVNGQTAWRKGKYFWATVKTNNTAAAQWENIKVASGGVTNSGNVFVPQTPEQFSYDADGNLTNDGRWAYTWDGENRLIGMTVNTNVGPVYQMMFGYDFQGRRIQKIVATNGVTYATKNFLYDGWNLVAEVRPDNTRIRTYVWGSDLSGSAQGAGGVGGLLEVSYYGSSTTNAFVAYDGNGNVAALVNAADGTMLANYEYSPFGETIRSTGLLAKNNPFRFSTKYQDGESDQLYYGYRYYNEGTGRWVSRDPSEEDGGNNLSIFVDNNPVNAVDISGLYLAAIDGTDSEKSRIKHHANSFVHNFYDSYLNGGGLAIYKDGPNLFGGGVQSTVNEVYTSICDALKANPSEEINLVGHSRGGLIAILVAKKLHEKPCPCAANFIRFMGLYDAVDRYLWANAEIIPDNVIYVAHARRDPGVHSRPLFSNTGTSGGRYYTERYFWVTHSGAGGDPWGGDHPLLYGKHTIDEKTDDANSPLVDQWIRSNARQNGLTGI